MARANTNLLRIPNYRSGQSQWFCSDKEYGILLSQDTLINTRLRAFFVSRRNVIFANAIVQRAYTFINIYIPIFIMTNKYSIHYFYKTPGRIYFPYFDWRLKRKFKKKERRMSLKKQMLLNYLKRSSIDRKNLYLLLRSILPLKIKVKIILISYLDYYANLLTKYIAFHLTTKRDFRKFKQRIATLLSIGRNRVQTVGGAFILCTGRLNVRKVLRKQRQWLNYRNAPINTYSSNVFFYQAVTKNKFGTYGIKLWLYITRKKVLFTKLLQTVNKPLKLRRKRLKKKIKPILKRDDIIDSKSLEKLYLDLLF